MKEVFSRFKYYASQRCDRIALLYLGEDSIRYDFFCALAEIKNLNPWDIQLESAIDKRSFVPRNNIISNRAEKPQMDLVVETNDLKLSVEFGLFRQNSNDKGNIDKTARTVKILNDMIRLGLDLFYTKRDSYFVCIADDKLLGHQLQSKIIGRFPSHYLITSNIINEQRKKKTSAFDDRFVKKFEELKLSIDAKLIFDEEIKAIQISRQTKILIWKIALINNM
jgi:hypothetical protein